MFIFIMHLPLHYSFSGTYLHLHSSYLKPAVQLSVWTSLVIVGNNLLDNKWHKNLELKTKILGKGLRRGQTSINKLKRTVESFTTDKKKKMRERRNNLQFKSLTSCSLVCKIFPSCLNSY